MIRAKLTTLLWAGINWLAGVLGSPKRRQQNTGTSNNGEETVKHLITIAIGPVQEFIASARRSRDLWFGSWLLSELSKSAAHAIVGINGGSLDSLIFPAPQHPRDLEPFSPFSVANKVLGEVQGEPQGAAEIIEQAVRERLDQIAQEAFSHIRAEAGFDDDIAWLQVRDLLEFYWVAVEVQEEADGSIKDHAAKRAQVEALLAARKTTRDFDPPSWMSSEKPKSSKPKSSLDGQRESVIPENVYKPRARGGWEWSEKELRLGYGVRKGERLCGVGLLKRHGQRGEGLDRFFSTSHVASLSLMDRFNSADPQQTKSQRRAFKDYLRTLRRLQVSKHDLGYVYGRRHPVFGNRDGHLLFAERLHEFVDDGNVESARTALKHFLTATVGKLPLPYYALLQADGDRMGKVIDNLKTESLHRQFSQALTRFAGSVSTTVENCGGSLVYAGGDDVLAFLPLHRAIECAQKLATDFEQAMKIGKDELGDYLFSDDSGKTPTLSAGLVVAHHLDPLSDVLELARQAEMLAKSIDDKNALAITVSKRSGVDRTVKGKWGKLDHRLTRFIEWHCNGDVPDGAAYELDKLTRQLAVAEDDPRRPIFEKAIKADALRIWGRKRALGGAKEVRDDIRQEVRRLLDSGEISVAELAQELIVARMFADAKALATPSPAQAAANGGNPQ